jgi:adenine C2-methylase RlmN of 23S rRNA A2503 and tRNA A37
MFQDETQEGLMRQAQKVFEHYIYEGQIAQKVHFNFMARGEPLDNKYILRNADEILLKLANLAVGNDLIPKFAISTILPRSLNKPLTDIFRIVTPTIYYSLYSVNDKFRDKWIPQALPVNIALDLLREYQDTTKKIIKIHFPMIKGENDSEEDILALCDTLEESGLICDYNLVHYNPFSLEQGEESDDDTLSNNFQIIKNRLGDRGKIIPRVGFDVKASCGMFVEKPHVDK